MLCWQADGAVDKTNRNRKKAGIRDFPSTGLDDNVEANCREQSTASTKLALSFKSGVRGYRTRLLAELSSRYNPSKLSPPWNDPWASTYCRRLYMIYGLPGSLFLGSMFLQSQLAPYKVICQDYILRR